MNILVVNDDGINAIGIKILARKLKKYGNVIVCAPDRGRSASAHSIILESNLAFEYVENYEDINWYKISGTPADCTRMALDLIDTKFDIVFSGINKGLNIGTDIIYSGTVAAAREANIEGYPAVAISAPNDCYEIIENELDDVLDMVFNKRLYSLDYVLNINFPTKHYKESKGYKVCRQGIKNFKTKFIKNEDGSYRNSDSDITYDQNPDTDVYLAYHGYITLVPLKVEQTNYIAINELENKI